MSDAALWLALILAIGNYAWGKILTRRPARTAEQWAKAHRILEIYRELGWKP